MERGDILHSPPSPLLSPYLEMVGNSSRHSWDSFLTNQRTSYHLLFLRVLGDLFRYLHSRIPGTLFPQTFVRVLVVLGRYDWALGRDMILQEQSSDRDEERRGMHEAVWSRISLRSQGYLRSLHLSLQEIRRWGRLRYWVSDDHLFLWHEASWGLLGDARHRSDGSSLWGCSSIQTG